MNTEQRPPLRRRRRYWLAAVMVLLAVTLGATAWNTWDESGAQQPEYLYATVQRADFEDLVSAAGSLQPRDYVDVGAQVSGQLRRLLVEVGDEVIEGQLLAEIDAEQSVARVDASRASLRAQQAQLKQSEVTLKQAERDYQRLQNLWKAQATTQELVENAETAVALTRAQIEMQQAQIEQTEASMRVDEANLEFTRIFAPMTGTVVSVTAKQGETLNANQAAPTILRIADLSVMTVQTEVSEADISKLEIGVPAYFTTLGSQGQRWNGNLAKIEPTPNVLNNVVLYNALFDVDNADRKLMTEMTAQVFFIVSEASDALLVPMAALNFQRMSEPRREAGPGTGAGSKESASRSEKKPASDERRSDNSAAPAGRRATVKVAAGNGFVEREVIVGLSSRVQAQILSGLEEGERIVVGLKPVAAESSGFPGFFGSPRGVRR